MLFDWKDKTKDCNIFSQEWTFLEEYSEWSNAADELQIEVADPLHSFEDDQGAKLKDAQQRQAETIEEHSERKGMREQVYYEQSHHLR